MNKYNIYGVGGALVDTEINVSDRFLKDANVEKGVMTLVDQDTQARLLNMLSITNHAVIRSCGGSVCNSLVAASRLGSKVFFSGKVANDDDGQLFVRDLQSAGVDFLDSKLEHGITGKCLVMITPDAERTMNTFLGINESLSSREIDYNLVSCSDWLYLEGYLLTDQRRGDEIKKLVKFAKRKKVRVALSLSDPFVVQSFRSDIMDIISEDIDLIFSNKAEAISLTKSSSYESTVEELKNMVKSFVVTDGANGALIFDGYKISKSNGYKVNSIDTNGAGDIFAGTFLHAISGGKDYLQAADFANFSASRLVMKFGPRLDKSEYFNLKKKFLSEFI